MGAKIYKGERLSCGCVLVEVVKPGEVTQPLRHFVRHSPTGFEWGYTGSGPSELARCILLDFFGEDGETRGTKADALYQDFKMAFIAGIQKDIWAITDQQIIRWLAK